MNGRGGDHAALELRDVAKSFGSVVALASGSLTVHSGSIHALVGENGAGKSTLVKIVAGVHQRDGGVFRFHGEDVDFGSTAASKAAGIGSRSRSTQGSPRTAIPRPRSQSRFFGRSARLNAVQRRALRHGRCSQAFHKVLRSPYGRSATTLATLGRWCSTTSAR